jgi:hypothetical protein
VRLRHVAYQHPARRSHLVSPDLVRALDVRAALRLPGGPVREPPGYHCARVPVLEANGCLYRAIESWTLCRRGAGLYLALSSSHVQPREPRQREVPSLHTSPDARRWHRVTTLPEDDADRSPENSRRRTGLRYADWQSDGDETIVAVRAAYGAHTPDTMPAALPSAAWRTTATCCAEPRRWRRRGPQAAPCTTRPHTHREIRPCE